MRKIFRRAAALVSAAVMTVCGNISCQAEDYSYVNKPNIGIAKNNPLTSQVYCADPTAVEYNGRLWVFGTNDQQQCDETNEQKANTYEKIKSLVVLSTEDMINWEWHGIINVGEVAPWIRNSWAPSVVSRVEDDGLTHFYLYFSNNGTGVGVITATDPLGPWSDPLGKPLIDYTDPGLKDCPSPFDPGAVIDENGDGWLAFGGGRADGADQTYPGSSKIVKLGKDMVSFDSDFTTIPAPFFFEASELNYINGTYVYTYCSDWNDHSDWKYEGSAPGACSMIYMKTKTPLNSDSWEMGGVCLKNPGDFGFDYSNNHTHLQKYKGKWYMLYHTMMLKRARRVNGGYRSICVNEINVDEDAVKIENLEGSKEGVLTPPESVSAYEPHSGARFCNGAGITVDQTDMKSSTVITEKAGAWTSFKQADLGETEDLIIKFTGKVKGKGKVEVRLDATDGEQLAVLESASAELNDCEGEILPQKISGVHDLYFIFSEGGMTLTEWKIASEKKPLGAWVYIAIGGGVLLLGAAAFILIKRKGKKGKAG